MLNIFSYTYLSSVRCICSDLLHHFIIELFVFFLLSFNRYLYILSNSSLSNVSFANIFSQSLAYILITLMVSFAEQKILKFWFEVISFPVSWLNWASPSVEKFPGFEDSGKKSATHTCSCWFALETYSILMYVEEQKVLLKTYIWNSAWQIYKSPNGRYISGS